MILREDHCQKISRYLFLSVCGKFKAQLKSISLQCFKILDQQWSHIEKFCSRVHAYVAIKEYTSVKHISEISPLTMPIGCRSPTSTASRSAGGHRSCAVLEERAQSASSVIGTFRVKKVKQIYPANRPPHSGPGGRRINLSKWTKNAKKCKNITLTIVFHRNGFNFNVGFKKS